MSRLLKRALSGRNPGGIAGYDTVTGGGSISQKYTGVGHRENPATGDLGPDAPGQDDGGGGRPPRGPRGRNRRLGGVRSPLS